MAKLPATFPLLCGTALFLATSAVAQLTPGLYESRYSGNVVSGGGAYPAPTNTRIVRAPYAANSHGLYATGDRYSAMEDGVAVWPPPSEYYPGFQNGVNVGFRYTGYINIPEGSNTVTFLCVFTSGKRLFIDGEQLYWVPMSDWNGVGFKTVTLTTGWHAFDAVFDDNGQNGWGIEWNSPATLLGFGIDWEGRGLRETGANRALYYTFPVDPGDGSLFSCTMPPDMMMLSSPAVSAINAASATVSVSLMLAPDLEGTLWVCHGTTDPGATTNGWTRPLQSIANITHANTETKKYTFDLNGLELGEEYYYRFAFIADNGASCFSAASSPFKTRINIDTLAATDVDAASAILRVRVNEVPDVPGTLCVFYNEGDIFDQTHATREDFLDTITASGVYGIPVTGLTVDTTYSFRHAYDVTGVGLYFADSGLTFTTVDYNTPSTFQWIGGWWDQMTWPRTASWENAAVWQNINNRPRPCPGVPGDRIRLANPVVASLLFTTDTTFGALEFEYTREGDNWGIFQFRPGTPAGTPVTLSLNPGNTANTATIGGYALPNGVVFGETTNVARRDDLRVHLAAPLDIVRNKWGTLTVAFHTPVSGGTADNPVPITVGYINPTWADVRLFLASTNNTFRGDIIMNQTTAGGSASLYIGDGGWSNQSGWAFYSREAHDAMFGDAANKVILRNGAVMSLYNPNNTAVLDRTVLGPGVIRATSFDSNHDTHAVVNNVVARNLHLGARAKLSPAEDAATIGTMRLSAASFACDRGATFNVKIKPNGVCDKFVFDIPGDIRMNGARVVIDDSALSAAPREANATWTFATVNTGAEFSGSLRASPGYVVRNAGNSLVIQRQANIFMLK